MIVRVKAFSRTRKVMSPQGPDLVLSADVPNIEARVLVGNGLDVESDGGDSVDFAGGAGGELEGVEDGCGKGEVLAVVGESSRADISRRIGASAWSCCALLGGIVWRDRRLTGLSGGVKTQHQQAHFLAAKDLGQRTRECGAHGW